MMRLPRWLVVALVVVMAASGLTVASHATVVSELDSASDLDGGAFSETQIVGSGESATVGLASVPALDEGFEDGNTNIETAGYTLSGGDGVTTNAIDGTYSLVVHTETATVDSATLTADDYRPPSVSFQTQFDSPSNQLIGSYIYRADDGTELFRIVANEDGNQQLKIKAATTTSTSKVVDDTTTQNISVQNIDYSAQTFEVAISGTSYGTFSFANSADSLASVEYQLDSGTNIISNLRVDDVQWAGQDTVTGSYTSPAMAADSAVAGETDVSSASGQVTVTWQGSTDGGATWTDLTTATYTTSGVKSETLSSGYDEYRAVLDLERTAATGSVNVDSVAVTADTSAPSVDNSSASPQGNPQISNEPTLSINGSDADFGTAQDDELTVAWYINGSQVATTTETANGTWTYDPSTTAGTTEWHVEVTDSYGHTTTSDTFLFTTPSELSIFNESAPTALVDNVTVELRYFYDETNPDSSQVFERSTSDGTIDLSGLPADEPFIVVADAEGYLPRRIYVKSLYDTQSVYLLPDSSQSVSVRFELQDYSGEFPTDDTVMLIQRPLNGTWQTVHGDRFGATGEFPAQLRYNVRHRLVLLNTETGDERVVGPYTPLSDTTQTVRVQADANPTLDNDVRVTVSPSLRQLTNATDATLTARIAADDSDLSTWTIEVLYGEGGTVPSTTLAETSGTDPDGGSLAPTLDLSDKTGGTVLVHVTWTTEDGVTDSTAVTYRVVRLYDNEYGLLPVLSGVPARLPGGTGGMVTGLVAVMTTLGLMSVVGTVGASTESVGLAGVLTLGGFGVIGWVGYGPVMAAAVAWTTMAGLRRVV